jgi:acetylglutamate kinase
LLTVVKVGGSLLRDEGALPEVARLISEVPGRTVVVHGGGPEISLWQERLGIAVEWRDGLRVSTADSVQVASMVLSGWMNKRIVSALMNAGQVALGVSGEDGGLLEARRKEGGCLGDVGEVVAVNQILLRALITAGTTPVISPISRGPAGVPLNVNADEAAIAVAAALSASRLLLISDVPGVLVDGAVVPRITADSAEALMASGAVTGGMTVKLRQALVAAAAGVEVRVGGGEILCDTRAGTRILRSEEPRGEPAGSAEAAEATP